MKPTGLEAFRRRMRWSKTRLAEELGRDRKTIGHYLSGSTPIPRCIALACSALAQGLPPME